MAWNHLSVLVAICSTAVVSCGGATTAAPEASSSEASPGGADFDRGIADLYPKSNSNVHGTLVFRETPDGLRLKGEVDGLEGGRFAVSVHSGADCSAYDGKSVGPVLNPEGSQPPAGLLGNAIAKDGEPKAEVDLVAPKLHLQGNSAVLGHAVVVHAWPSDPSVDWERVPYLACGVVEGS
jgi:Cu/Zn superoxide dismutase